MVSGISALGWFHTSIAVVVLSTCPIDELDFDPEQRDPGTPGKRLRFPDDCVMTGAWISLY